jgi:hypothetical protein
MGFGVDGVVDAGSGIKWYNVKTGQKRNNSF